MIVITNEQYTSIEHIVDAFYPMVWPNRHLQ